MEIRFANYGQLRDVNPTDGEKDFAAFVIDQIRAAGMDPARLEMVRRSDDYVALATGLNDYIRFKVTKRARWFMFALTDRGGTKRRFESVADLGDYDFAGEFRKFAEFCEKYGVD